ADGSPFLTPVSVTLATGTAPTGTTLGGTTTVSTSSGVASFSGLTLNKAGTVTLVASVGGVTVTSNSFTVNAGTPNRLDIVQQPLSATINSNVNPFIRVEMVDANNNHITPVNAFTVTLTVNVGPGTITAGAAQSLRNTDGFADFTGVQINTAGTYSLNAG